MSLFPTFARLVAETFQRMAKAGPVFVASVTGDDLYAAYLGSFPEGTDPMFRKRTEHDCSSCKNFVRRVGNVVAINGEGAVLTVWDTAVKSAPEPYNHVASVMREKVLASGIDNLFRVTPKETSFGTATSRSQDPQTMKVLTWDHFYTGPVPASLQVELPGKVCGDFRTTVEVFERGLIELTPESLDTVISLVEANNLYRGEEHKPALTAFRTSQRAYLKLGENDRRTYAWAHAGDPAARFRNTVIGTLVQDLSEGRDLESAVKAFEAKVAPANYKRTSALITPAMVVNAMATIKELDLEPALERRFAVMGDISVKDVLWVDGSVKPLMKGGIGDMLMSHAQSTSPNAVDESKAEEIGLDAFMADVLPKATGVEILFKNEHLGNLMVLTAPVHPEPKQLFRWTNDFAWAYGGNVADSYLRQQVQSLGGRVDGVLRFSHMWNHDKRNASLMDLHVFMPGTSAHADGMHDRYPAGQRVGWNRRTDAPSGGVQDVDYVQPAPEGYVPVENITFPTLTRLKDGQYTFKIHNWQLREPTHGGFRAEIEFAGQVFQYDHSAPLKNKEWITLAVATLKGGVFTIEHEHPVGTPSQEKWGVKTGAFVKVNTVTISPNYWGDNKIGNRHAFFVLDGAVCDEPMRGIFNEFLHPRLEPHRKVLEVVGDKTKCQPVPGSLAGLGFSSTKKDSFVVRVRSGKALRTYNVKVGS